MGGAKVLFHHQSYEGGQQSHHQGLDLREGMGRRGGEEGGGGEEGNGKGRRQYKYGGDCSQVKQRGARQKQWEAGQRGRLNILIMVAIRCGNSTRPSIPSLSPESGPDFPKYISTMSSRCQGLLC